MNKKQMEDVRRTILNGDGYGIIVDGRWYRTDGDDPFPRKIWFVSGPEMMPMDHTDLFNEADIDVVIKRMEDIAPISEWQTFDEFFGFFE